MSLISLNFFMAFFIVCAVYFVLPAKAQWVWLLIASLAYYFSLMYYSVPGLVFFFVMLLVNWAAARFIGAEKPKSPLVYRLTLVFDVGFLVFFKYMKFLYDILLAAGSLFGLDLSNYFCDYLVYYSTENSPQRISYFALILIAYITDVYWGNVKAFKNPGKAILFTSFFPLMTSGPIVTAEQMEGQLWGEKHRFSYDRCVRGMERVLWGLFKKLVIAERLATVVNRIYGHYESYNGLYIFLAAGLFAFQLYCDFSGLMDIVLGSAEVLGIILPENFRTPFYSLNLSEFWRRWHITLGGFLRDYVLLPVQNSSPFKKMRKWFRKRFGKDYTKKCDLPLYLSLLISWFLIGLWHGGGWNYIFGVGLYMWAVIVLGELLKPVLSGLVKLLHINTECASYRLFLRVRTFLLFMFGLSFFRAKDLAEGFKMWKFAFFKFNPWIFFDGSLFELGLDRREWGIVAFGGLLLFTVSFISQKRDVRDFIKEQNFAARLLMFGALFAMIVVWGCYGSQFNAADFIYGRF